MSNNYFQFKQFTVWHDQCAMKVGTDGTLLGAWAPVSSATKILDIGTGTGLMALMLAQRNPIAHIVGVDLDESAYHQAVRNVEESKFWNRIDIVHQDILAFAADYTFDLIVCNPPFFKDSLKCPEPTRSLARHNDSLPFEELCRKVYDLLSENGMFCVVLPADLYDTFSGMALKSGLFLNILTKIYTKNGKPVKRVLMGFSKKSDADIVCDQIVLLNEQGEKTEEYRELTDDFYLK